MFLNRWKFVMATALLTAVPAVAADLNDLSAFVTVARAGGFRDAAKLVGVSASA